MTLDAAWDAVHDALPARWHVGEPSCDPGTLRSDGHPGAWSVTAWHRDRGRLAKATTVTGTGDDAIAALRDLDDRLRGVPKPDGTRMDELRARLRLAYVDGAEEWARENVGRAMTADEMAGVVDRYEGMRAR